MARVGTSNWPPEGTAARLLVPMDGSPESANALAVALRIARPSGSSVTGLHVARRGVIARRHALPPLPLAEFAQHGEDDAEEARLAMLPAPIWGKAAGVPVSLMAARGGAAQAIAECAAATAPAVVVMGAHGQSGRSGGKTLGSVAREVYGASKRPTIVLPPKAIRDSDSLAREFSAPGEPVVTGPKVIAAIDGGPGSGEVTAQAVELARRARGALRIFSGAPTFGGADVAPFVSAAQQAALAALVQFKVDTGSEDALAGLTGLSEQEPTAIIVVGARAAAGRPPGEVGSFTQRLLGQARCAVAVVPVGTAPP
jgi:nucleotide-binding universal stress UspA family protein